MSRFDELDEVVVEQSVRRRSILRIGLISGIVILLAVIGCFYMLVEHRNTSYHAYTRQLYYDTLFYQATNAGKSAEELYDYQDNYYYYIYEINKITPSSALRENGTVRVVLEKDESIAYVEWTRLKNDDFIDRFAGTLFYYPPSSDMEK